MMLRFRSLEFENAEEVDIAIERRKKRQCEEEEGAMRQRGVGEASKMAFWVP